MQTVMETERSLVEIGFDARAENVLAFFTFEKTTALRRRGFERLYD